MLCDFCSLKDECNHKDCHFDTPDLSVDALIDASYQPPEED